MGVRDMKTLQENTGEEAAKQQTNWTTAHEFDSATLLDTETDQTKCFEELSAFSDTLPYLHSEGVVVYGFCDKEQTGTERITFKSRAYKALEELDTYTTPANKRKIFLTLVRDRTVDPHTFCCIHPQWAEWYLFIIPFMRAYAMQVPTCAGQVYEGLCRNR